MKKLLEGAGAGYTVTINGLKLTNIEFASPQLYKTSKYNDVSIAFKADIVDDIYHYFAEGYDWNTENHANMTGKVYGEIALSDVIDSELASASSNLYDKLYDMYTKEVSDAKYDLKYYSGFLNDVLENKENDWLEATKSELKESLAKESFNIRSLFGAGYVYVPAESPLCFRHPDGSSIMDYSSEYYGVAFLSSALINSPIMCDEINAAHSRKDDDYETYEDYENDLYYDYEYDARDQGAYKKAESKENTKPRLKEDMSEDGETLYVYSSSKDTDLFKYYFSNTLEHGLNASSAYGLGTYAVLEPPFNNESIGYDAEKRDQLYGDNCFKFKVPTRKVFFLNWSDFSQTALCKELQATERDFIAKQLDYFQIDPKVKNHIEEIIPIVDENDIPDGLTDKQLERYFNYLDDRKTADVKNSYQAQAFYRLMSRYYYQNRRGALRTPIIGFVYTGVKDGRTFVGWNAKGMIPVAFTNDLGQTWQECDTTSPEYIEYVQKAESFKFDANNPTDANRIFDGHPTPEKEGVYRLFTKYNSGDDESNQMSAGVFQNIVIHDDKTVDCKFKSNHTQEDLGQRLLPVGTKFMQSLAELGYKFGNLDAGLKFGHESVKVDEQKSLAEVPADIWPNHVTGGLRIAGQHLNKETMNIPTVFDDRTLLLAKCCIDEDVFDGWNVVFKNSEDPKKQCFTPNEEVWNALRAKYDWMDQVAKAPLEKPTVKRTDLYQGKMADDNAAIEAAQADLEAAQAANDEKAIKKATKALEKAQYDLIKHTDSYNAAKASAEATAAKNEERATRISTSWKNHVERVKKGWVNESISRESLVDKFFECDGGCAGGECCGSSDSGATTAAGIEGFIPDNPLVKKDLNEGLFNKQKKQEKEIAKMEKELEKIKADILKIKDPEEKLIAQNQWLQRKNKLDQLKNTIMGNSMPSQYNAIYGQLDKDIMSRVPGYNSNGQKVMAEGILDIEDDIPGGDTAGEVGYIPWKKQGPCEVVTIGYDTKKKEVVFRFVFPNPFIAVPSHRVSLEYWQKNFVPKGCKGVDQVWATYNNTGVWKAPTDKYEPEAEEESDWPGVSQKEIDDFYDTFYETPYLGDDNHWIEVATASDGIDLLNDYKKSHPNTKITDEIATELCQNFISDRLDDLGNEDDSYDDYDEDDEDD